MTGRNVNEIDVCILLADRDKVSTDDKRVKKAVYDSYRHLNFGYVVDGALVDDTGVQSANKYLDVVFGDAQAGAKQADFLPYVVHIYQKRWFFSGEGVYVTQHIICVSFCLRLPIDWRRTKNQSSYE